eukprot:TRINITY_DN13922_c0_g1_i1.p1 TRINITY_DN13922_c0_g1~~TRINITY_DN13922_c0_g1_i1.p1  ORF type:complete len:419 (-),score=120.95 TRINITY_DN13922_c0_g1_i1:260-1516(-)
MGDEKFAQALELVEGLQAKVTEQEATSKAKNVQLKDLQDRLEKQEQLDEVNRQLDQHRESRRSSTDSVKKTPRKVEGKKSKEDGEVSPSKAETLGRRKKKAELEADMQALELKAKEQEEKLKLTVLRQAEQIKTLEKRNAELRRAAPKGQLERRSRGGETKPFSRMAEQYEIPTTTSSGRDSVEGGDAAVGANEIVASAMKKAQNDVDNIKSLQAMMRGRHVRQQATHTANVTDFLTVESSTIVEAPASPRRPPLQKRVSQMHKRHSQMDSTEASDVTDAATKVQAIIRGRQTRHRQALGDATTNGGVVVQNRPSQMGRRTSQMEFKKKPPLLKKPSQFAQYKTSDPAEDAIAAATQVQAMMRGRQTRKEMSRKQYSLGYDESLAATKMQAMVRGRQSRKEMGQFIVPPRRKSSQGRN